MRCHIRLIADITSSKKNIKFKMENKKSGNNYFPLVAGLCAAFASFIGKCSGKITFEESNYILLLWAARTICVGVMIFLNTLGLSIFVKSLHASDGTLNVTIMTAASNYFISFILGVILFQEYCSITSFLGLTLILLGLVIIINDDSKTDIKKAKVK